MIAVVIWVLVILLIFGVASYIIRSMEIDAPTKNIVLLVVGVLCLIALLYVLLSGVPWPPGRVVP